MKIFVFITSFFWNIFILCPVSDYRDQGLTRPKVLIVVPFRDSALRIINMLITLLTTEDKVMEQSFLLSSPFC